MVHLTSELVPDPQLMILTDRAVSLPHAIAAFTIKRLVDHVMRKSPDDT